MNNELVFFVSDCCGAESDADHAICSRCGEHCEILTEVYEADYIPGYDDGECDPIMGDDDAPETDDAWLDEFWNEEDFA